MGRMLWGGLLIALMPLPLGAGENEKMTITVSPHVAFAPGRIVVRASVEPDAENRALEIVADSTDYYRSSTVQLNGDRAVRTTVIQFRSLPLGDYRVSAHLLGVGDEVLATVHHTVIVTEPRVTIVR